MADITQEMTAYRIKQIEFAEAEYYEQLTKVLDKIEDDITSLANKSLSSNLVGSVGFPISSCDQVLLIIGAKLEP